MSVRQWQYLHVFSSPDAAEPESELVFIVTGSSPRREFATIDETLTTLGAEGWECIFFEDKMGPFWRFVEMRFKRPYGAVDG